MAREFEDLNQFANSFAQCISELDLECAGNSPEVIEASKHKQNFAKKCFLAGARQLMALAEEWCSIDAYDSNKTTDEHTCDNSRGYVCGADELLNYLKRVGR